jgi:hypothetical protein
MRMSRYFSLLEIMVGLALVLMASGVICSKMIGFIEKRRFRGDLEQLKSRILTVHAMALNMQADWEGILKSNGKDWTFEAICLDPPQSKAFSPIKLHISEVLLDGKKQEACPFLFFSTGEIWPAGTFQFRLKSNGDTEIWDIPAILGKSAGDGAKKRGPAHPDEA